jgi:hypothetical protein
MEFLRHADGYSGGRCSDILLTLLYVGGIMGELDLVLSAALGIGLAAATGFRVFLPLLVMSLAANALSS